MKLGLKRKIVLVFIGVLAVVTVLDALLASYFTKQQNQDAAFATLKRDLLTWQDELQDTTLHMRAVALSAIGETVALNQLSTLEALEYKLADALHKNREIKEAARTLAFNQSVSLNRLHLVLRSGGFSAIAVYIDGKLSHQVSVSEVGMFVQRGNGERVWVKAAADGNGNLPLRSWPAWEEGPPPAVAASLAPLDGPRVAFTYPSADSMMIEVAVPVEGVIEHSLLQGESQLPEISVIDPHIAGSAGDPSIFTANRPSTAFAMVVFQKRIDPALLQSVERKTGMWPLLFSPDGQHSQQLGPLNLSLQELLPNLADASNGIKAQTVSTGQGSFYAAALPWQFEQQPGFVLALVASQDGTLQNIRQTVVAILMVTGLILALSIGIGLFWLGRFIDPIIALTKAVKAIGLVSQLARDRQSDYRLTAENLRPLAIQAPGEVGDLAWAFDVMIGELHHSFNSLEQRVQDRTAELRALHQILEEQNRQLEEQSVELSASNYTLLEEINERRLIEDLLRLREQEFRSLAENSPDNIARYDREGRIRYWNSRLHVTLDHPEFITSRAHIGKTTSELYPDGRFDAYEAAVKSVIESGLETEYEAVGPDIGAGTRHHLVRMVAERDRHGEVIGVLAMGRDITERKRIEETLKFIAQSSWKEGGESFLTALARYLGKMLDVDYVIVDKLAEVPDHAETVALYAKGEVLPNMQYDLRGTPCENVMEGELCCYATDVQRQFPEDILLVEMQVDSYSGIPLRDSSGKILGLIAVMDGKPIEDRVAVTSLLQLVATRAAAELEREQSELALAESRQFLKQVIDTIPYPVFVKDREHRWILLNQEFCDFIGHPMESLLGQSDYDFFPAQEADVFRAQDEVVFNSGKEAVNEEEFTDRQGLTHNILTKKVCYADDQGRQYLVGIILDITERKQYELNLLKRVQLEEQLSCLAASVPGFIFTRRVDADGHASFPFASAGIEQLFGLRPEDIRDDAAMLVARYHPDDLPRIAALAEQSRQALAPFRIEIRIFHPDNGLRWIEIRSTPQRHSDGSADDWHGLMIDITERKQMEEALGKSRQILTEAQRIAHVGSWELNLADNRLSWSDEIFRIFEIDPALFEASYETFIETIHPDDREAVNRAYTESLEQRTGYEIEHRLLMADGRVKYVLERCETRYGDDGKPLYSMGTVQDITERKRMEAELLSQADFRQTILNAVADAGMQVMMLEEGRIIHVGNRKLAYEFGFTDEDIDAHPVLTDIIHPDDRERILDYHIRRVTGEALPASYELGLVTRSGERREYETSVAIVPNTHPVRVISVGKDISKRKRMETELKSQADFQQTLLNAIRDVGMQMLVIENGRMVYVGNRASAIKFGFIDEEIDAHPSFIDFVHPDDRERVMGYHVSRQKGEAVPSSYELGLVNRNGERREFETSVAVVPGTDPVRTIAICKDITERKRMEKALAAREQELRALAESSPGMVGSFYSRPDGSVCMPYVSANISELFGLSPEDVADDATPLLALNHPADALRVMESIAESARTMTMWHTEFRILHPILGERWMEGNTNPQPHPDGGVIWYGFVHDITERKQAEAEKQRLVNILEQSADFIGSADMQGNLTYHNRAALRMIGLAEDADLSAMHISDMHPAWAVKLIEEIAIPAVMTDGVWRGESALLHRDGSKIPVSQVLMLHRDTDGKPEFMATIMQDITERKHTEDEIRALNASLEQRVLERTEELRRQTSYLRTMIDTLPMMVWFKDKDCRFLVVNQALATACSHSVDDLIGKSDLDVWSHEHAEAYRADDVEVMATGQLKIMEESFIDVHGGAIWVETFKAPVVDEDGRVLGTVGVARDISERRAVEAARETALAEAERLARLRSEFMARMSHELRTPLNGILGYTQILQVDNSLSERQGVMLNVIQQSGEHLLSLINDILDFAKIEAGKQELSLSNIHLPGFLRNLAGIVSVRAEQKQLAFICDIATDVPEGIRVDETRLRQVLLNLLSNAVKYSEQGQISLRVKVLESGCLHFEIQDCGIGIDDGQLETIFQPFVQAGDRQHHNGGSGLGLVISRELVRLMGSDIHVSSQLGVGSTFWFDLDAPVVDVGEEIILAEQHIAGYRGSRRRVLVVDDVDLNRVLLVNVLERMGFETVEAESGRACLDSVEVLLPDLVLLDMVMPGMDGLEVARRLRAMPGFGQTPIIAVSADASGSDANEALKAGIDFFLSKPVDIKSLMTQIAGLLKLDWIYALPEAEAAPQHRLDQWLETPPMEEMNVLHQLAQEGSMRDIIQHSEYLAELDAVYRPFAEQLRSLAQGYQSKAILDLVERYINRP